MAAAGAGPWAPPAGAGQRGGMEGAALVTAEPRQLMGKDKPAPEPGGGGGMSRSVLAS